MKYIQLYNKVMYLCVVLPSGFSQSGVGGTLGSSLPPFQTSMSSALGQTGMGPALDTQKSAGTVRNSDGVSSGGPRIHSQDHSAGIKSCGRVLPHYLLTTYYFSVL